MVPVTLHYSRCVLGGHPNSNSDVVDVDRCLQRGGGVPNSFGLLRRGFHHQRIRRGNEPPDPPTNHHEPRAPRQRRSPEWFRFAPAGTANNAGDALVRLGVITGGVTVLWLSLRISLVDRVLSRLIGLALVRFTDLETRDSVGLLRLSNHWVVAELEVSEDDWLCDVALGELLLPHEGVLVLGIERNDGRWIGSPGRGHRPPRWRPGSSLWYAGRHQPARSATSWQRGRVGPGGRRGCIHRAVP